MKRRNVWLVTAIEPVESPGPEDVYIVAAFASGEAARACVRGIQRLGWYHGQTLSVMRESVFEAVEEWLTVRNPREAKLALVRKAFR